MKTEFSSASASPESRLLKAATGRMPGKALYGFLFVFVIPAGLVVWAHSAGSNVGFPPVLAVGWGWALVVAGAVLTASGMLSLWIFGKGLPMNAYPPPLYVTRGAYRFLRHPIYVGFSLLWIGASLASGSAAGLWLVCPVAVLSCAALVFGYENIDLRERFGDRLPEPVFHLPSADKIPPKLSDRFSVYVLVLMPWAALYELLASRGIPRDAVSAFLPFEAELPVIEWTEWLYASTYLLVALAPWVAPTKRALRDFAWQGLAATFLMLLFFTALPLVAPPRPFTPHGWAGQLLLFERRLDTPANAFPSYHAFWVLLAMSLFAARMPRLRYVWWGLGAAVCVSCLTTGMHALVDVAGGAALFFAARYGRRLWELLRLGSEKLANSWREWQWGGVRLINHGLYAGIGAALAVAIAGVLLGPRYTASVLLVGFCSLVSAALWAQFVEGSPSLLRPYGYYGGVLGILLGGLLARLVFGNDPWLLLAAYGVAGPWVQSFGRLRCLVQGCCHGRAAPTGIGIVYLHPRSRVCRLAALKGVPIHPTPLYSILWNIVIAAVMAPLWIAQAPLALIVGLYLILTGVGRFVEESYRGEPQTKYIKGLRFYQWIAVFTVVAGAIITCVKTPGAPPIPRPELLTLALAAGFGVLTWGALGVDFPRSNRRFARLA